MNYQEQKHMELTTKLRELLLLLPDFLKEYFRGISEVTSPKTRYVYAHDLKLFFNYITTYCILFKNKQVTELTLDDLELITVEDIEEFIEYVTVHTVNNKVHRNKENGKARKLACIKSMYKYFIKKRKIKNNPAELVEMPKIKEKNIIKLERDEVIKFLKEIDTGLNLTQGQQKFHPYTRSRDLAIVMLLLGTGMRISELVGINKNDIDFNIKAIKILRKGGDEAIIYFSDEVKESLADYLLERNQKSPLKGHEDAMFLSIQNTRLTDRAIQNLVKKYFVSVNSLKNISPHKLRSTFGTNLYRQTRDIYLVADMLGHKDINTTRKHYAKMDDERKRDAANQVKLLED